MKRTSADNPHAKKPSTWQSGLVKDSGILFGIRIAAAGVVYVTQLVLARWLGAEELGLYVYATAWLWILAHLSGMGLPQAAQRFVPRYLINQQFALCRGFVRFSVITTVSTGALIALLFVSAVWVHADGNINAASSSLMLAALIIPLVSLNSVSAGIARANFWFYFASLTNQLLRPILLLMVIIVGVVLEVQAAATSVLKALLIIAALIALVQGIILKSRLTKTFTRRAPEYQRSVWLLTALPIILAELFISFFFDLQIIFARTYLSLHDLAIFNIALRTVAIMAFGVTAVGLATAPRAARLFEQGKHAELQSLIRLSTRATFFPSLFGLLLLIAAGQLLLSFFGPEFKAGYGTLVIASAAQLIIAYAGPILPILSVSGFQNRCLPPFIMSLALIPLLYWLFMPRLGMEGGAVAFLLIATMLTVWLRALLKKHMNLKAGVI